MESKKQTALEYYERLVSDIFQEFVRDEITKTELIAKIHNAFYPAIAMERCQIYDAYTEGKLDGYNYNYKDYYNETYNK